MRRSKYGAVPTVVDGVRFASKREAARYQELRLLEKAGEIGGLELQPKYPIEVRGKKICTYIGDFKYRDYRGDRLAGVVVEDTKGVRTPAYRLKRKLVEALYGIEIRET